MSEHDKRVYIWYGIEVTIERTYKMKPTGDLILCDIKPLFGVIPEPLSHFNVVKTLLKKAYQK